MAQRGWTKVAAGLQKVGNTAVSLLLENGQELSHQVAKHGSEVARATQQVAQAQTVSFEMMLNRFNAKIHSQQAAKNGSRMDSASNGPFPDESLLDLPDLRLDGIRVPPTEPSTPTPTPHTEQPPERKPEAPFSFSYPNKKDMADKLNLSSLETNDQTQKEAVQKHDDQSSNDDDEASTPRSGTSQPDRLCDGVAVPETRAGRAWGFASLGMGLMVGAATELVNRVAGSEGASSSSSLVATDANADRLAATLCRMRGAALKMGQMLSIQDESLLPPSMTRALEQVRQGAFAMPKRQLVQQLENQLGSDWKNTFAVFEETPFAAASIGQVHKGDAITSEGERKPVAVKVQYPGVANSIESDLRNLTMLVKLTGFAPKGLFVDNVIRVGRDELMVECDYIREMRNQGRFQQLVESDAMLQRERFAVPQVWEDLTTAEVLTSDWVPGETIDKVAHLDQQERNRIGRAIFYLTIQELFVWRFMQTDPNWGNFLYDAATQTTYLIDFGAAREYSKEFVDGYLRIVWANANRDVDTLMDLSHKMKFLTGDENDIMMEAHKMSGFTLGEPFASHEPYDFRGSNISTRLSQHSSVFLQHRLAPPPEEIYTLHRKLAGAFMLCIKLGAVIHCRDLLEDVVRKYKFNDGLEAPEL